MAKKRVADVLVDTVVAPGVKRVYGLVGDSLNGVTDSIRPRKDLQWVAVWHEETAARCRRRSAVNRTINCMRGKLWSRQSPFDQRRLRLPSHSRPGARDCGADSERGNRQRIFSGDASEHLFAQCSHYCELISQPEQMPRVLEIAMQTAIARRGVSVVAMPGDVALRNAVEQEPRLHFPPPKPTVCPADDEIETLAKVQEVQPKLQEAFKHDGPVLVEVLVHRQELSMPPTITFE